MSEREPGADAPRTESGSPGHQASFLRVCLLPALSESQAVGALACRLAAARHPFADVLKAGPDPVHVPSTSSDAGTRSQDLGAAGRARPVLPPGVGRVVYFREILFQGNCIGKCNFLLYESRELGKWLM